MSSTSTCEMQNICISIYSGIFNWGEGIDAIVSGTLCGLMINIASKYVGEFCLCTLVGHWTMVVAGLHSLIINN